jgi:hypothetical protein
MEGGSFIGDYSGKGVEESSEDGYVSLHSGLLGNPGTPLTGNFKRYLEGSGKGASLFAGAVRGLLSGDMERHGKEGSVDGHHSPWGPCWGI